MYHCASMCKSVLAGLVAVTGSADLLRPWDSLVYGFAAAGLVHLIDGLLIRVSVRRRVVDAAHTLVAGRRPGVGVRDAPWRRTHLRALNHALRAAVGHDARQVCEVRYVGTS